MWGVCEEATHVARTSRFWVMSLCGLSLSISLLGFWALLWIFSVVPVLGILLPIATFVFCCVALAGWICTEQPLEGEKREWVRTKPEEIPAITRGPVIGVWKDPEATRMPNDPDPAKTWFQDNKAIVGIMGLKASKYSVTIQGAALPGSPVPFGWGMEFIGRLPQAPPGGNVADAAKTMLRIVHGKGSAQRFVFSVSENILKEEAVAQPLCSEPGHLGVVAAKVHFTYDGSCFQFWSHGVRRPDLDVKIACILDRVEVSGLAEFRAEVHKFIKGRLVSRRGHVTEGKDLHNASVSREQAERDVMTMPNCMGFTYDMGSNKAYFKQVDYAKRGGFALSTGNHISCVLEEENGAEGYTNDPQLPWTTSQAAPSQVPAPRPVTIGAPQEEVPLLAATEPPKRVSQVPGSVPAAAEPTAVLQGPGSRMATAGAQKDLVAIEVGVGWAIHGLAFVWSDGSRTGTVLEHDTTVSALTNKARLGTEHKVDGGRRLVKVSGKTSKGGYLAYELTFHFDAGSPIKVASTHERWAGNGFEFKAKAGHHIVDLTFGKGTVVGIKEQANGPAGITTL